MKKMDYIYKNAADQKNPLEGKKVVLVVDENDPVNADGVCGHLEIVGDSDYNPGFYEKYMKRLIDIGLSIGGLLVLFPVYLAIAAAIKMDDPGPVLFTQKRLGRNKKYFKLHKFRSMKMCTPHDVPTHEVEHPEQYITRVGKFLRAHSLDELPQIWDIFVGNMSVIGPRPGLWNQDFLTAERDKYGANDVKPGLTGWAQINGRDELEIPTKARLDGEYVQNMGIKMDIKCFLGSVGVFVHDDGVIEGGTGEMKREITFKDDIGYDKELTLSIVTYNSCEEIPILMDSLKESDYFEKMNVYVVDNASADVSAELIKNNYPWVHLYSGKDNLGFGRGHNLVIEHVKSKYHIIANPDIRVEKDTLRKAVDFLNENPDVVVVTPYVRNVDGSQQFLPKRNPSMKYMVGGMFERQFEFCRKWRDEYTLKDQIITEPINVEFCSGAFMIIRTDALHKVGGFDDRYFLHFEDADLTRELRKVGRAVYNPQIIVTHKWQRDNKKIDKSFWTAFKSMLIYMKKWR
jgi:lipopolysaccharide/colanic/teichoic acid biosynthesis glycosyltransferase/GT2 family glycosyltransferase